MAIIYMHDGGLIGNTVNGQQTGAKTLTGCSDDLQTNIHSSKPYLHARKKIGFEDFGGGCICPDAPTLAIGDVVTLFEVPAGQMLKDIKWDISNPDPTLSFDIEVRKTATPNTAGTVIEAALGAALSDKIESPNLYFSKYGVATCAGKDCYGDPSSASGRDHGVVVLVVKALPTGIPAGCATTLPTFGQLKATFDIVVTDLI